MYNMAQVKTNMLDILEENLDSYFKFSKDANTRNDLNEILFFGKVLGSLDMLMRVFRVSIKEEDIDKIFEENLPEYRIVFYNNSSKEESFEFIYKNKNFKES